MTFKSEAQRRLCWLKYNQNKKKGKVPDWDCKKYGKDQKNLKKLPYYKIDKKIKKRKRVTKKRKNLK